MRPGAQPATMPPDEDWGKRTPDTTERWALLGPHRRRKELRYVAGVSLEILRGFRELHFVGPCVTVFGSARFGPESPHYDATRRLGRALAEAGFAVMTGGGPGLMEAANRGAREGGGCSLGCNIILPAEQRPNAWLDKFVEFRHFFVRKLMLAKYSYAFIAAPGGYGTLDELFEVAVLIQTGKMVDYPIVLFGVDYWAPLVAFLRERMVRAGAIAAADIERIVVTDSPEEAATLVRDRGLASFGLTYGPRAKPRWWLFERPAR